MVNITSYMIHSSTWFLLSPSHFENYWNNQTKLVLKIAIENQHDQNFFSYQNIQMHSSPKSKGWRWFSNIKRRNPPCSHSLEPYSSSINNLLKVIKTGEKMRKSGGDVFSKTNIYQEKIPFFFFNILTFKIVKIQVIVASK